MPHRDFIMISRAVIDVGITSNSSLGIHDQIARISPLHIVRIENLKAT
ncbi:MAG: hypothetical protein AB1705_20085 [Verrucomicrobiota bacterium]